MLKIIAAICMLIDHIGFTLFPEYFVLRIIGRLAMPLFAYSLAQGFVKTHSLKKYLLRMGIFAGVSQIPFWLFFYTAAPEYFHWKNLNIGFTFFTALVVLHLFKGIKEQDKDNKDKELKDKISKGVKVILILSLIILADKAGFDYGGYGILVVLSFYEGYLVRKSVPWTVVGILISTTYLALSGGLEQAIIQSIAIGALPIILFTKDIRIRGAKYFFYAFYPLHMLLLVAIKLLNG